MLSVASMILPAIGQSLGAETKVPAIPPVTDGNATQALRQVKHLLDVREGRLGDLMDANVTFRDLVKTGLAVKPSWSSPSFPVAPPNIYSDGYNPATDYTPPAAATNLTATGGIGLVILQWDTPNYRNHSYAEIWRAETNVLGNAVLIATSDTRFYTDSIGSSATRYYWVRFVSVANVTGPYQGTSGVVGTTGQDPAYLLQLLQGQLSTSQLNSSLNNRINLIDASSSVVGSVAYQVSQEAVARASAILAEASTRATEDSALQTQINTLSAASSGDFQELIAALQEEQTARIAGDTAEATSRETLATQMRGTYAGTDITQITSGLMFSERQARSSADSALSTSITGLSSTVTNNYNTLNAALQTESTTRATAVNSLSTQITTLQSTVTNNNSTLNAAIQSEATTRASVDGGLLAQYTIKADVNGYVSGFGLASTSNNAAPTSEFQVRADVFKIASPSGPGIVPASPFIVRTTPTTIGGVSVPVGVYIQDAFIANGTINNAKIANAAIDNAKIANLDAAKITTGLINADRLDASVITAKVLEVASAKITGQLTANQINGAGLTITGGQFTGYAWPSSGRGFYLGPSGFLLGNANNGTFFQYDQAGGNIYTNGLSIVNGNATFSGNLNVVSPTGTARMEMTNTAIRVFDANNVVRVRIGYLL